MSTQRDHVDPLLEEIPTTSTGEEMDPKVLDLAMKIAEKIFLKIKEEDVKKWAKEEESRRKAEEDKGKGRIEYNNDLVELLVSRVMSKVSFTTEGSSTKSKGNKFNKVQFDYSRNFIPNFSSAPLGKLPTLSELNYDEWADKMKSHLIGVHRLLYIPLYSLSLFIHSCPSMNSWLTYTQTRAFTSPLTPQIAFPSIV
jgi:hypothetical protein